MRSLLPIPLLLATASVVWAQNEVADPAAEERALASVSRKLVATLEPAIVEVEALGGIPEQHKVAKDARVAKKKGVLAKRGFKQAFGPSTGLIVRADGIIATSTFVLNRKPRHLIVTLQDGRSFAARLLGRDDSRALAILKVDANDLPVPRFAKVGDIRVGRYALALGRGLGAKKPVASMGIVSARNRIGGRAIQSSAAISPVNYGGPLVSIDGRVLGLVVPLTFSGRMASVDIYDSGIGFAVPAPDLLSLLPRLTRGERLQRGILGVVPDRSFKGPGVRVAKVAPGSPAAQAGLREGDQIVRVEGTTTDTLWQLNQVLGKKYAGDTVTLHVKHGGDLRQVKVKLGLPPKPGAKPVRPLPKPPPKKPDPDHDDHDDHDGHDH